MEKRPCARLGGRYTAAMVRRNQVTKQKDAMAQQLETLVTRMETEAAKIR